MTGGGGGGGGGGDVAGGVVAGGVVAGGLVGGAVAGGAVGAAGGGEATDAGPGALLATTAAGAAESSVEPLTGVLVRVVGNPAAGATLPTGSGAGGAPAGGRVELEAVVDAAPGGVAATSWTVGGGAAEKMIATRPMVAAAEKTPASARAEPAGWCRGRGRNGARRGDRSRGARVSRLWSTIDSPC